jgi:hypothetical protein
MTTMYDNPGGLPLDSVYKSELDTLRRQGFRLMELGLFADRRESIRRSLDALMGLMRYAFYLSVLGNHPCGVIGVHPHHADFYRRMLGFQPLGRELAYPTVQNNPVVLLFLDVPAGLQLKPLPRGLRHFVAHPLDAAALAGRYGFDAAEVTNSTVGQYLAWRQARKTGPADAPPASMAPRSAEAA